MLSLSSYLSEAVVHSEEVEYWKKQVFNTRLKINTAKRKGKTVTDDMLKAFANAQAEYQAAKEAEKSDKSAKSVSVTPTVTKVKQPKSGLLTKTPKDIESLAIDIKPEELFPTKYVWEYYQGCSGAPLLYVKHRFYYRDDKGNKTWYEFGINITSTSPFGKMNWVLNLGPWNHETFKYGDRYNMKQMEQDWIKYFKDNEFKELLKRLPNHDWSDIIDIDIIYNGVNCERRWGKKCDYDHHVIIYSPKAKDEYEASRKYDSEFHKSFIDSKKFLKEIKW